MGAFPRLEVLALSVCACAGAVAPRAGADVKVEPSHRTGLAWLVAGAPGDTLDLPTEPPDDAALWRRMAPLFGITDPAAQLTPVGVTTDAFGWTHARSAQVHRGTVVFGGVVTIHRDAAGRAQSVSGDFFPVPADTPVTAAVDETAAVSAARRAVLSDPALPPADPAPLSTQLVIVDPAWYGGRARGPRLAYLVRLIDPGAALDQSVFVDARSGQVLDRWDTAPHDGPTVRVYDASSAQALPGVLARQSGPLDAGAPVGRSDIDRAHDAARDLDRYLRNAHQRRGLDGQDGPFELCTGADRWYGFLPCANARWLPAGAGSRAIFCAGHIADDVVAHELVHGLTEATANLFVQGQARAINESMSDVFAELVDLYNGGVAEVDAGTPVPWETRPGYAGCGLDANARRTGCTTAAANARWLHAEDTAGGAIRDMWQPSCIAGAPDTVTPALACGGDAYALAGVLDRALALCVDGPRPGSGIGPVRAGAIWYRALTVYLAPLSDIPAAQQALLRAAADLVIITQFTTLPDPATGLPSGVRITPAQVQALREALDAIGLSDAALASLRCPGASPFDPAPPPECPRDEALTTPLEPVIDASCDPFPLGRWCAQTERSGPPGRCPDGETWSVTPATPPSAEGRIAPVLVAHNPEVFRYTGSSPLDYCTYQRAVCRAVSPPIAVPASGGATLGFWHWFLGNGSREGLVLEVLPEGSGVWQAVPRSAFLAGAYNGAIDCDNSLNPLRARPAWTGFSAAWVRTLVDLTAWSGTTIRLGFTLARDGQMSTEVGAMELWYVDAVAVSACADCPGAGLSPREVRACSDTGRLGPDGCSLTLAAPRPAAGPVRLSLLVPHRPDLAPGLSAVDIRLRRPGAAAPDARVLACGPGGCTGADTRASVELDPQAWNAARTGGRITIDLVPVGDTSPDCLSDLVAADAAYPPQPATACESLADLDGLPGLGIGDMFALLRLYFAGDRRADLDCSGAAGVGDLFAFFGAYFSCGR